MKSEENLVPEAITETDYKAQLEIYKQKVEELENIIAALPGHVYWKDRNGINLGCNTNNWKDFGFGSLQEYIGTTAYEVLHIQEANQIKIIDEEVMETGQARIIEEPGTASNKEALYLSHKAPLKNKEGRIIGVLGVSIDITKAKQETEDKLKFLEDIIDLMPGHVYWKDKEGVCLGCNTNNWKDFGLKSLEDYKGKSDYDLFAKEDADYIRSIDEQVMQTGQTIIAEEPLPLANGNKVILLSNKVPLRNRRDEIIGIVGISIDVTEVRRLAKEVHDLKEREMQQQLEGMRLVGASIAHELRTPLTTIKFGMENIAEYLPSLIQAYTLAKENKLPIESISANELNVLQKNTFNITREADLAHNIIDMLLIRTNPEKIKNTPLTLCSINECVNSALERYPFKTEQERQLVTWNQNNDFNFRGDQLYTVHVLFNLIKNALHHIHAAHRGHIEIWSSKSGDANQLHFKDTSQGIAAEHLPHIFQQFFSQRDGGTGVGLAFCKMVMNSFGGDINCHSQEGEYTEFVLKFPSLND